MNLFVTGGTGFLGKSILRLLFDKKVYDKVFVLIRPTTRKSAEKRFEDLLNEVFGPDLATLAARKFSCVSGDLLEENFGMSVDAYQKLVFDINQVLHVGANTDFGAPIDVSRKYNVEGTKQIIKLTETIHNLGRKIRLDYVSTAFVAGVKRGIVNEETLSRSQDFANNYERSKWEAECLVQCMPKDIPAYIYRPSIVVGDSSSGYTPHFKVLYWPLRLLSKKILPVIPSNSWARLDVVPVDFVSESIVALIQQEKLPLKVFLLTAGMGKEVRLGSFIRDANRIAGIPIRPLLPIALFDFIRKSFLKKFMSKDFWQACEMADPYYFYLKGSGVRFDASHTQYILKQVGIRVPQWKEYRTPILRFCVDSRWGKRLELPRHRYYESPGALPSS